MFVILSCNMTLHFLRISLFLTLIFSTSCNGKVSSRKKPIKKEAISYLPDFPQPNKAEIRKKQRLIHGFFKEEMNPKAFNGQFLVAKNGKVIYFKSQGFANFKKKEVMTSSTPIHVASVSKVATALAILRLVDQKKIKLDSDVRRYIKDFPYKGVSVRMLLNHRSGVPYYGYYTYGKWHLGKTLYNNDVLGLLNKHKFPLNFPPGTKFAYCNTNYALLALIIEKVSGHNFPRAMQDLVFIPLKMKNSFILNGKGKFKDVSQSYNSKHQLQEFDYLDAVFGDKNLYTTALDLLNMDKGTYSSNFLSDSLRLQMFKGYSYEKPGKSNYGLGIRMREMTGKDPYFFHTGWWHGNTACYASMREDTVCVIAISNVYTQNVYRINRLAEHFGNYPFDFSEE